MEKQLVSKHSPLDFFKILKVSSEHKDLRSGRWRSDLETLSSANEEAVARRNSQRSCKKLSMCDRPPLDFDRTFGSSSRLMYRQYEWSRMD